MSCLCGEFVCAWLLQILFFCLFNLSLDPIFPLVMKIDHGVLGVKLFLKKWSFCMRGRVLPFCVLCDSKGERLPFNFITSHKLSEIPLNQSKRFYCVC